MAIPAPPSFNGPSGSIPEPGSASTVRLITLTNPDDKPFTVIVVAALIFIDCVFNWTDDAVLVVDRPPLNLTTFVFSIIISYLLEKNLLSIL